MILNHKMFIIVISIGYVESMVMLFHGYVMTILLCIILVLTYEWCMKVRHWKMLVTVVFLNEQGSFNSQLFEKLEVRLPGSPGWSCSGCHGLQLGVW